MSTVYSTTRGPSLDPLPVELWTVGGQRLGKVGAFESMAFTFTAKPGAADTAELELYLDDLTATLLPCDGSVLVSTVYNGKRHLSVPVTAEAHSHDDDPNTGMLTVNTVGGWSFLEAEVITPGAWVDLNYANELGYSIEGALESVIKRFATIGAIRNGHPIVVPLSLMRGPSVHAAGAFETVGEVVAELLRGTNYRLVLEGWVPGDPQPHEAHNLTQPCYVLDVVAKSQVEGLAWSTVSGDIPNWQVTRKRANATRAIISNGADELAKRTLTEVQGDEPASPWGVRELYIEYEPEEDENMDPLRLAADTEAHAVAELTAKGPAVEVSIEVASTGGWEFGTDGLTPRQFDVGDKAAVELPVLGTIRQEVTDVELRITPTAFTVTPTVGTPDTLDLGAYGSTAELNKRVTRLERKRG